MRFGDSSGDCRQSLGWRGFYMGPEVRVLVQHFSRFPSGTPCDTDNFLFFREAHLVSAPTSGSTASQAKSCFCYWTVEEKVPQLLTWHCSMPGPMAACWASGKVGKQEDDQCVKLPGLVVHENLQFATVLIRESICNQSAACHRQDAEKRTEAHWQEVQHKKAKLADLRQQKSTADSELGSLISKHANAQKKLNEFFYDPSPHSQYSSQVSQVNSLYAKVSSAQSVCSSLQKSIDATGKAPPPVIQPLPKNPSSALVWLFYMHMPSLLRQLSRASFLARQLLLPSPDHAKDMDLSTPIFPADLLQHYNQYQQPSQYLATPHKFPGCGGHVLLLSCSRLPQKVGPDHVDDFGNREQGVWYPDSLAPNLAWKGSGCSADHAQHIPEGHFNPFGRIPDLSRVLTYTEKLPASAEMLQWAMPLPESEYTIAAFLCHIHSCSISTHQPTACVSPGRGNLAIAYIDQRPSWLSEPGCILACLYACVA
eukprot:1161985-Pelagomonas_calceolata.AAC.5